MSDNLPVPIIKTEGTSSALENVKAVVPVIKHNFQGGFWEAPNWEEADPKSGKMKPKKFESIKLGLIIVRGSLRRLYTQKYDPNIATEDRKPPECWSLDGQNGAREEETLGLPKGHPTASYRVFGDCDTCFFSKFGSSGKYHNDTGKGQLCSQYTLIWGELDGPGGMPIIVQLPPTGSGIAQTMIKVAASKQTIPEAYVWELFAEGGGKSSKNPTCSVVKPIGQDEYNHILSQQRKLRDSVDNWCRRFVSGTDLAEAMAMNEDSPIPVD